MKNGGIPWDKIVKMINESKKNGDPLANMIYDFDFRNNEISVLLNMPDDDEMEEMTSVDIDIN